MKQVKEKGENKMDRLEFLKAKKKFVLSTRDKLFADLSKVDRLKADIDHILELNDLSGSELLITASKLSKLLKKRGEVKEKIRKMTLFIPVLENLMKIEMKERGDGEPNFVNKDAFMKTSLDGLLKKASFKYEGYKDFSNEISLNFIDEDEKVSL